MNMETYWIEQDATLDDAADCWSLYITTVEDDKSTTTERLAIAQTETLALLLLEAIKAQ